MSTSRICDAQCTSNEKNYSGVNAGDVAVPAAAQQQKPADNQTVSIEATEPQTYLNQTQLSSCLPNMHTVELAINSNDAQTQNSYPSTRSIDLIADTHQIDNSVQSVSTQRFTPPQSFEVQQANQLTNQRSQLQERRQQHTHESGGPQDNDRSEDYLIIKHRVLYSNMSEKEFLRAQRGSRVNVRHFYFKLQRRSDEPNPRYYSYQVIKKRWPLLLLQYLERVQPIALHDIDSLRQGQQYSVDSDN